MGCLSTSECLGSTSDGCQLCQNNICVFGYPPLPPSAVNKTATTSICTNTEQDLRNQALSGGSSSSNKIITLCENSIITLSQELIITTDITIQCAKPHTCTIQAGGKFRLITFTSGNVKVDGISFRDGNAEWNVRFL